MSKSKFFTSLQNEVDRLDQAQVSKRHEVVIEGFSEDPSPRALINGRKFRIFNSNDYLGLRHHPMLKAADHAAVQNFGTGPGAVRFISGTLKIYQELEQSIAQFHGRDDAMVFSSAFATNVAVLSCLIKGQSKDSLVSGNTLVISDELNHRSIIEGIRAASIPKVQKAIFKHMDANDLERVLNEQVGQFDRVIVVTDGIFSMLGEFQDLADIRRVIDRFDDQYEEGVLLVVDDAHGVGCFGQTGRGVEEVVGAQADVLVGTMGKAFGSDGGYVTGNQVVIDYLRESAATYIYSNSISPGTAGAALAAFEMMMGDEGPALLTRLSENIDLLKGLMKKAGLQFAANSDHPIQPLLVGDAAKCKAIVKAMREQGFLVTSINYPVVPKGRDEIRIQISASHTREDIEEFVEALVQSAS
jgi:glycine C-acetyltransferase